ncbi:MAG: ABC transporter permease [Gemmatimonadetes bacterium]|nr:ABC transporter permease [Gemmatimonadota bacterium]
MIDAIRRDLAHALRSLRRTPALIVTIVLVLGLGIGMTTAMFTVFQSIVLRKLPVQEQDRLVTLTGMAKGAGAREFPLGVTQYRRFRDQTRALSGVTGYAHWGAFSFPLNDGDRPLVFKGSAVTANFFDVLGVQPVVGRFFTRDDEREWGMAANSGDLRMVLSYDAWRRAFRGDSAIVGRRLSMPVTKWAPLVVGVAPAGLDFPRGVDYWMASAYQGLDLVARLAPGSPAEAARVEYFNFIDNDPEYAELGPHTLGAQVHPFAESILGEVRIPLMVLTVAVGLLLLLACVNVGNLLLLRAAERVRELAIRQSLGASSLAIVRSLLVESGVLAVVGGAVGFVLSRLLLTVLLRLAPEGLPRVDMIRQAGAPIAVSTAVTVLTVFLFGLLPALGTLRFDLSSPLRADARGGTEGRRLRRLRQGLVSSQIALALVVLAGAGLLMRSFSRLVNLDLGYPTGRLSIIGISPAYDRYLRQCGGPVPSADSVATRRVDQCVDQYVFALHDRAEERFRSIPEIRSAATAQIVPFLGPSVFMTKVIADRQTETEGGANPWVAFESIGPDYFRTFQVPVRGRSFNAADRENSMLVGIVTEGIARSLWPGEEAIGRRLHTPGATAPESLITVVGVVPDLHYREYRVSTPTLYRPYRQCCPQGAFAIRTRGSLAAALPSIRAAVRDIDPEVVVTKAEAMDDLMVPQLAQPRLNTVLLLAFALAALLLAAIGLYGIMASAVSQQTRELGVRLALGATPDRLRKMVLGQALAVTGGGAVVGLLAALAGTRLLTSMLFEISPSDPVTLIGVSVLLLSVALLAAYLPARRATKIDPARALRAE